MSNEQSINNNNNCYFIYTLLQRSNSDRCDRCDRYCQRINAFAVMATITPTTDITNTTPTTNANSTTTDATTTNVLSPPIHLNPGVTKQILVASPHPHASIVKDRSIVKVHIIAITQMEEEWKILSSTIHTTKEGDDNTDGDDGIVIFQLGSNSGIVRAVDTAVATMKKGEVAKITAQPRYAYRDRSVKFEGLSDSTIETAKWMSGEWDNHHDPTATYETMNSDGNAPTDDTDWLKLRKSKQPFSSDGDKLSIPPIILPPNSTVVYYVKLIDSQYMARVTDDGGVMKRVLTFGHGDHRPNDDASCSIRWRIRKYGERTWLAETFWDTEKSSVQTFVIGKDATSIRGLEDALRTMYAGEHVLLTIQSEYAFGTIGISSIIGLDQKTHSLDTSSAIVLEVELLSFEKGRETFQMTDDEKIEYALKWKERGNESYKLHDYARAVAKYNKCVNTLQYDSHLTEEQQKRLHAIKAATHVNMALCYDHLQQGEERLDKMLKHCNLALELDTKYVKALYRRALILIQKGEENLAEIDLSNAAEYEPHNQVVKEELRKVRQKLADEEMNQRKLYSGLSNISLS